MSLSHAERQRLLTRLDAVCDQRAQAEDIADIERLVLASEEARWLYLTYLDLHGTLVWDTAGGADTAAELACYVPPSDALPMPPATQPNRKFGLQLKWSAMIALVLLCGILVGRYLTPPEISTPDQLAAQPTEEVIPATNVVAVPDREPTRHRPVELSGNPLTQANPATDTTVTNPIPTLAAVPARVEPDWSAQSLDEISRVSRRIDFWLAADWEQMGISPSPRVSDVQWLRRAMLDLAGRIPTVPEVTAFLSEESRNKRRELVDQILADGEYARNFTTVWSNLLIGRSPQPDVDQEAFHKYLRMSFATNRPWNAVVADLVSAEGNTHENGATNYLVAHLNNQAVPATAITARLFLGQQLQCAQCHNHPFNDVQQSSFWELNSLFQQAKVVTERPKMMTDNRRGPAMAALTTEVEGGPIYYETTNGLMKVAFPRFNGQDVDPAPEVNRRKALATLLTTTDQPQLAAAFVNRMWAHFFGAGFTTPVDDMGPHNPPCHPEVLNILTEEFVRSGYDIQRLVRWITDTEAYQLASRPGEQNISDDIATGDIPLFSRVYPKPMTAEQLYDSLLTATQAHQQGVSDWAAAEAQRQAWLDEFVVSLQNDENGESETLSGTYAQALTVMNGDLMDKAVDLSPGTFLGELVRSKSTETEKIRTLCLAALSREPTPKELAAMQRLVHESSANRKTAASRVSGSGYQDLFWALLNSNEFAIVH
ncbi:DUF1549 domain-containing protein [bacterium]|nr:DUF1549 domain-containing protein [bacterium]